MTIKDLEKQYASLNGADGSRDKWILDTEDSEALKKEISGFVGENISAAENT
jgi:hypothetical protein